MSQFDFSLKKSGEWQAQIHFYSFQKLEALPWKSHITLILRHQKDHTDSVSLDLGAIIIAPHNRDILEKSGIWQDATSFLQKIDKLSHSRLIVSDACEQEVGQ